MGELNQADRDYAIGRGLAAIRFHSVLPRFGYHQLAFRKMDLHRVAQGSTFDAVGSKELRGLSFPVPPLEEQRHIADVLDSLDDEISSYERIIAKLHTFKSGLLEDLVGEKSPDATLAGALLNAPSNGIYKPAHLIGRGTLLVGQTAFTPERRVDRRAARRAVVTAGEKQRFALLPNDILVSRVFATLDGVGQPAFVGELGEAAVYESNMMRLRCDRSKADPFFVFQTLLTKAARSHVVRMANLSNQASISQSVLRNLPVWLPSGPSLN